MNGFELAQAGGGQEALTLSLFAVVVLITLAITVWASRQNKNASDYYAAGRNISGLQNGLAIGGDYMSAASFLGIAGAIALFGYDGFLYSIGFLVAWLVALFLVAELLRNSGRYTMGDVLAYRMRQRPVRTAAGRVHDRRVDLLSAGADGRGRGAGLAAARHQQRVGKNVTIARASGALMIIYVSIGGMTGTTWVQIVKAVLLMGRSCSSCSGLPKFNSTSPRCSATAAEHSGKGAAFLEPGSVRQATRHLEARLHQPRPSRWCSAPPACRTS